MDTEDKSTKKEAKQGSFNAEKDLKAEQLKSYNYFKKRIPELQKVRINHYGYDLDSIWAEADRDCIPHRLKRASKKVVVTDEDKGWRGKLVSLGSDDWQSDISQSNAFIKIQTALSILVDQNPSGVFTPASKKFQATNDIIKQLYSRSWEYAKSKPELKKFVFNLAKYGWACARTFPLRLTRTVKVLKEYNQEEPEKSVYEEKEVVVYNDIMRENLDPRNVWLDDQAKPNNSLSVTDWAWRKVYTMDKAKELYDKYPRFKFVEAGGNVQETVNPKTTKTMDKSVTSRDLVEAYFYENLQKDLFMVVLNGVPVVIEPLPIADGKGLKKLSLWQTYWNLRHAESPYGVGIYESIRYDQAMLDRISNMTVDQLTISIYKMFFYQGTQSLSDTGDIRIQPGVGKQVLDPKNINWLEVPGPGKDAYLGIDMFQKRVDDTSGITPTLEGEITGKTAFEIAQAKESALKRLKNPLDNILEALNEEGYITVSLCQLLYSIPEMYQISDERLINDYLEETKSDPELFERIPQLDEQGQLSLGPDGLPQQRFMAKVYPEFPLNLEKDEKGNLLETPQTQFFRLKPSGLKWEGVIQIKSQSLLTPSKQVEKALDLEMYNMLIPLMQSIAQERLIRMQSGLPVALDDLTNGKTAKEIVKLYDKDPRDIFPDEWLEEKPAPLFTPPQPNVVPGVPQAMNAPQSPDANKVVSSVQGPQNPTSLASQVSQKATAPFRV